MNLSGLERYRDPSRMFLEIGSPRKFYLIPHKNIIFDVIASIACGWEHVSVVVIEGDFPNNYDTRIATYDEIVYIKKLFWGDCDICIQIHPKRSEYVNIHENCLHIWRRIGETYTDANIIKEFIKSFPENNTPSIHVTQLELNGKKYCIITGPNRWPNWNEVCQIKQQYFETEEAAVQYHFSQNVDLNNKFIIVLCTAPTSQPSMFMI